MSFLDPRPISTLDDIPTVILPEVRVQTLADEEAYGYPRLNEDERIKMMVNAPPPGMSLPRLPPAPEEESPDFFGFTPDTTVGAALRLGLSTSTLMERLEARGIAGC